MIFLKVEYFFIIAVLGRVGILLLGLWIGGCEGKTEIFWLYGCEESYGIIVSVGGFSRYIEQMFTSGMGDGKF